MQKKREDKDDDGEECDKEVVGVNSNSKKRVFEKQSENALKMLTKVAAEVNAEVAISRRARHCHG